MSDFEKAIDFVLGWETQWGRKIRHRAPGEGWETMYGISQKAHPEINFDTLTEEIAKAFYFAEYWERFGCHEMRWPANMVHFDACVNIGNETAGVWHGRANKILQRALGVKDDGNIGPVTRIAMRESGAMALSVKLIVQRQKYYRTLSNRLQEINLNGWLNRVEDLMIKALI